jgi:hypothetical protein
MSCFLPSPGPEGPNPGEGGACRKYNPLADTTHKRVPAECCARDLRGATFER